MTTKELLLHNTITDVIQERSRQDEKWGEQNWDPFQYMSILTEEVGEAAQAANDANTWKQKLPYKFDLDDLSKYRKELVQVAAVAVAAIECLDRNLWNNLK